MLHRCVYICENLDTTSLDTSIVNKIARDHFRFEIANLMTVTCSRESKRLCLLKRGEYMYRYVKLVEFPHGN
jgi:hypothetical protein